jgi:hypothetical protein
MTAQNNFDRLVVTEIDQLKTKDDIAAFKLDRDLPAAL